MKIVKLVCILVSTVFVFITPGAHSAEIKSAVGLGFQYGGIFGWQGSLLEERHRGSVGLGLLGASVGYDYGLTGKVSVGVSSFLFSAVTVYASAASLRMHYYPNGTFQNGWVVGLDIVRTIDTGSPLGETEDENYSFGFISVGYGYK